MNNSTAVAIENMAGVIRTALDLNNAPYNLEKAVKTLGGEIKCDVVDSSIDAYVEKDGMNRFIIHLNNSKPKERQNFSIAHEIGHLFLHMGYIINDNKWKECKSNSYMYRMDNNFSLKETEANEFAAAFLMPKDEFLTVAEKNLSNNYYSIPPISQYFCVSDADVINRGKWLGIFQC